MASIEIRGVDKSFGATHVLHDVDLDVADGEFLVLVGPSGCGKSTLLRIIAGLEEVSGGEIIIGGRVVNDLPPKDRDIAMVFQNYALYPHMTVRENMAFSLKLRKEPRATVEREGFGSGGHPQSRLLSRSLPAPAFRWPAPARGDGPRDRARPPGIPVRRAAFQSRRQAARADARRDQVAAPAPARDVGLCHARPDRSDDDGRPDRRARRTGVSSRSVRRWSSTTTRPTSSSPGSSARRR